MYRYFLSFIIFLSDYRVTLLQRTIDNRQLITQRRFLKNMNENPEIRDILFRIFVRGISIKKKNLLAYIPIITEMTVDPY